MNLVKELCTPLNRNFVGVTQGFSISQLHLAIKELRKQGILKHVDEGLLASERRILTHSAEFSSFIRLRLDKNANELSQEWMSFSTAVCLFTAGVTKQIDVTLEGIQLPIRFLGKTYHDNVQIIGDEKRVVIKTRDTNLSYHLQQTENFGARWVCNDPTKNISIGNEKVPVLVSDGQSVNCEVEAGKLDFNLGAFEQQVGRAIEQIIEISPQYYFWVMLQLKEILPLRRLKENGTTSSTSLLTPCHVAITNNASIVETVVMLVHETSHLYFHLLHFSIPLIQANAPSHHSILKNKKRPLQNILLGYHAFVNVFIILKLWLEVATEPAILKEIAEHIAHVKQYLDQLEESLEINKAFLLVDSGWLFFDCLRKAYYQAT